MRLVAVLVAVVLLGSLALVPKANVPGVSNIPGYGDIAGLSVASADYQETCQQQTVTQYYYGNPYETERTVCDRHWHRHRPEEIVYSTASAIFCTGVGFLAGIVNPLAGLGVGIACGVIVATVYVYWGPLH